VVFFLIIGPFKTAKFQTRRKYMQPLKLPGPKAKSLIERDQAVISPSYPRGYPFVMDHGKGSEVWDVDGNRFLDFAAGIAVASTGHSHPKVVKAIQEQAEKFIHISSDFYHEKWIELADIRSHRSLQRRCGMFYDEFRNRER
jgi:4-aminobutyrate aminotransferase-like enzyme